MIGNSPAGMSGRLWRLPCIEQSFLRNTLQVFEFHDAGLRCLEKPLRDERTRWVVAAVGEIFENLFEHKFEPRFKTVTDSH
jgi:hypothetical protein